MSWADEVEVAEGSASKGKHTTAKSAWDNFDVKNADNAGFKLNYVVPITKAEQLMVEIEEDDISSEVECWKNAVVCYVLGAHPPYVVLNGFVQRIWGKLGIDKVVMLKNGILLVRFKDAAGKTEPTICGSCQKYGHEESNCRKKKAKEQVIQKQSPVIEANKQHIDSTGNDTRKQGHIPDPNSKIDKTVTTKAGPRGTDIPLTVMAKILSWNTRGLNGLNKEEVKLLCNDLEVGLIGFPETRLKANKAVTCQVAHTPMQLEFMVTFVYAYNKKEERLDLWNHLKMLSQNCNQVWMVLGDFNAVFQKENRIGGSRVTLAEVEDFQDCIDACDLEELPHTGCNYTWNDRQVDRIFKKTGWVFVNCEWLDNMPSMKTRVARRKGSWNEPVVGYKMFQVVRKMKMLKQKLMKLHKQNFNNLVEDNEDRKNLQKIQEQLQFNPSDKTLQQVERGLGQKFKKSSYLAESFLIQRSKANWIRQGDDNTPHFFSVKKRRLIQSVTQIKDATNRMQHEHDKVVEVFVQYYQQLLGEKGPDRKQAHQWPDGYGGGFFKAAWDIIGDEACDAVQEFFHNGKLLKQVNATMISLIPKVEKPEFASQFRPISCCNTLYKCISKLLCSRLACVLTDIVNPAQAAFVKGRSLIQNVLVCHD
ncbi:hypothetical protein FXO37_16988 [Capsicum annuum]|nr:hypothetical protein FXO37_16988 [Capsicum annuum]